MSAVPQSPPVVMSLPASRGLRWCVDGLHLWRRAPIKLLLLCFVPLLVESVLQLIPWMGVTLSKLVVPIVLMGILLGLDELARGGRLRWSCLLDALHRRRFLPLLALAAMWGMGVFAVQQGVAWAVYGWPALDAVWLGHVMAHRGLMTMTFERVLLMSGILPSVLLWLAPCLFVLDGLSPWQSVCASVRTVLRFAAPFGVFLLVNLAVFALMLAVHWAFVLVLLIGPWSVACTYAVWRDVRAMVPAPMAMD
ncbi:hypothetical protein CS053_02335 [Rhodanobacter glycinis]|uniref:DUF2189 domain-containing protein n=1 Tax=Rhodanobacter glycinis TaxID=582702 RepID=A0A5B9DXP4_9GAMM|nr:hypothetical protein [Rhodanobacter glycinis]QEE23465.1 hypothetical protein CS053_02335 [Rhodanobacter glycinis]